jgi:hypothetical protein
VTPLRLRLLEGRYGVARLAPDQPVPEWASGVFVSITRTEDELSIVCDEESIPSMITAERGRRCLALAGPIPFEAIGIAASLTTPLAAAGVSLFLVSTFDTDYVIVKEEALERALAALRGAGHSIE